MIVVAVMVVGHSLWLFVVGCQLLLSVNHQPSSLSLVVVVVYKKVWSANSGLALIVISLSTGFLGVRL